MSHCEPVAVEEGSKSLFSLPFPETTVMVLKSASYVYSRRLMVSDRGMINRNHYTSSKLLEGKSRR